MHRHGPARPNPPPWDQGSTKAGGTWGGAVPFMNFRENEFHKFAISRFVGAIGPIPVEEKSQPSTRPREWNRSNAFPQYGSTRQHARPANPSIASMSKPTYLRKSPASRSSVRSTSQVQRGHGRRREQQSPVLVTSAATRFSQHFRDRVPVRMGSRDGQGHLRPPSRTSTPDCRKAVGCVAIVEPAGTGRSLARQWDDKAPYEARVPYGPRGGSSGTASARRRTHVVDEKPTNDSCSRSIKSLRPPGSARGEAPDDVPECRRTASAAAAAQNANDRRITAIVAASVMRQLSEGAAAAAPVGDQSGPRSRNGLGASRGRRSVTPPQPAQPPEERGAPRPRRPGSRRSGQARAGQPTAEGAEPRGRAGSCAPRGERDASRRSEEGGEWNSRAGGRNAPADGQLKPRGKERSVAGTGSMV